MIHDKNKNAPVFIPLVAGIFLLLAYWSSPLPIWIEWGRLILAVAGGTAVVGAAYNAILNVVNHAVQIASDARWHWYEPVIRLLEHTEKMNDEQIKYAREIGVIHEVLRVQPVGYDHYVQTPWRSLSWDWIGSHLELCYKSWPVFPSIGRFSEGSVEYKLEYAFNHWMTLWGLASERPGQEYVWKVTKKEATDKIYERDEEELAEAI